MWNFVPIIGLNEANESFKSFTRHCVICVRWHSLIRRQIYSNFTEKKSLEVFGCSFRTRAFCPIKRRIYFWNDWIFNIQWADFNYICESCILFICPLIEVFDLIDRLSRGRRNYWFHWEMCRISWILSDKLCEKNEFEMWSACHEMIPLDPWLWPFRVSVLEGWGFLSMDTIMLSSWSLVF